MMDIFGTTIAAGTLIAQFLSAYSAYSREARSLKARFDWDLRALQAIADHFEQRKREGVNSELSQADQTILEDTGRYLGSLMEKVQQSLGKIERKGLLKRGLTRAMWVANRTELKEMEDEVYSWTRRFDVRVLGLPPELGKIIPTAGEAGLPAVIKSNYTLRDFIHENADEKLAKAKEMLLSYPERLISTMTGWRDIGWLPVRNGSEQIIFSSRSVPEASALGTPDFPSLESDMGVLAAALSCLDPAADIRLLKVEYYFYHNESKQFLFAHFPPYPTISMLMLEAVMDGDPFPETEVTLGLRLRLAYKLAEAIFFLHTAGFLHKNITSSSIVALRRRDRSGSTSLIENVYLMGFDLIRGMEARTTKEGAVRQHGEEPRGTWSFDIFQHPDRQEKERSKDYKKVYDIYSLGVVLLEIGMWQPCGRIDMNLDLENPRTWRETFIEVATSHLGPRIGERYQRLVCWCLSLTSDNNITEADFAQLVMDPLENMYSALA